MIIGKSFGRYGIVATFSFPRQWCENGHGSYWVIESYSDKKDAYYYFRFWGFEVSWYESQRKPRKEKITT